MSTLAAHDLRLQVGARVLCRDLTVAFAPGTSWAILGPNGSGKSTLLHTLAGLRPADSGHVELDGQPLARWRARERAQRLALLLQEYDTGLPSTVLETVLIGRHPHIARLGWENAADIARAHAALAAVGLPAFASRRLATLSGGERRRVELAMTLTQDTPLLLLDEPTNHLDLRHQREIMALLGARSHDNAHTTIMVLHDINLARRHCSHALLLPGDGAVWHGPIDAVITQDRLETLYGTPLLALTGASGTWFVPG
jgi:iron complex transport system ATP-binding protein